MKLTIRRQLLLGYACVVAVFMAVIAVTVWKVEQVRDTTSAMKREAELTQLASQWLADVRQNSARSLAVAHTPGRDLFAFFKDAMTATSASTTATQKAFLEQVTDPAARQRADDVGAVRKEWLAVRDEINRLKDAGDDAGARALVESKFVPVTTRYLAVAQALVDGQLAAVAALEQAVADSFGALYLLIGVLAAAGVGAAVALAWRFAGTTGRALAQAQDAAQRLGSGALDQPIAHRRDDEIGALLDSLERARVSLSRVVLEVRDGVQAVALASEEIARGNADLSHRTEHTASNLQQTASSIEQITGSAAQSAESARTASTLATEAARGATHGGEVVGQVVATMGEIQASSRRIAEIIGTIDGIAFQTNILALNAAVEAARAGEQGRGFAVVASEVRSLAQRSAEAARDIKSLIGASVERVEAGSRQVQDAGTAMSGIVSGIERVAQIVSEISHASHEQSAGIGQVNGSVSQLDQMTQQNAALVEQAAAATQSLKDQAQRLSGVVATFRVATA